MRIPAARAGEGEMVIVVDTRERYPYQFTHQQVSTVRRAMPCGDYGVAVKGRLVASVERKSLDDLVASITNGRLRYALGELAGLTRAAVVVEDRYSRLFGVTRVRPSQIVGELAELQVRWPTVPVTFCETRKLAEEWTYRYLAAARTWALGEEAAGARVGSAEQVDLGGVAEPPPSAAEVRSWARRAGLVVPDRGRLRPEIVDAWKAAHSD